MTSASIPTLVAFDTYPALRKVLAARRRELGLTQLMVDDIAGVQQGYTGKIEAGVKCLGDMSFNAILGALGLKAVLLSPPSHNNLGLETVGEAAKRKRDFFAAKGRLGAAARLAKQTPKQRSAAAAKAANARWKKHRALKSQRARAAKVGVKRGAKMPSGPASSSAPASQL